MGTRFLISRWACNSDGGGCSFVIGWGKSRHLSSALEDLVGVFLWIWELHFQLSNIKLLVQVMCALAAHFVPQCSLYKREEKRRQESKKKRVGSRVGSCVISLLCFKQVWRELSLCLQLRCVRQAHCSSLKEWLGGFLSGDLLLLVLSTHHVWSVHDFELWDVVDISRNHSTSRTRAKYPGPQILKASALG